MKKDVGVMNVYYCDFCHKEIKAGSIYGIEIRMPPEPSDENVYYTSKLYDCCAECFKARAAALGIKQ